MEIGNLFIIVVCLFLFAIYAYNIYKRYRLKQEDILLNLGRAESKSYLVAGIIILLPLVFVIYNTLKSGITESTMLFFNLTFAFLAIYFIASALVNIYVTSEGFSRLLGTIPWHKITSYEWQGKDNNRLYLRYGGGRRARATFTVPKNQQKQLNKLLKKRL